MEATQAAQTRQQVAALYQAHALGLVKLAVLMVGDQRAAEDVVQVWLPKTTPLTIRLYSLATGTPVRTWTVDTKGFPAGFGWYWGRYSDTALTWLNGGHTLAVTYGINNSGSGPPFT